ncbi:ATP synthase subunit C [Zongyangia hominis]|uniref:ATPase n=1 Tax=Zongyangia hominis TaxID=2763677 RepID=A0A926EE98_9FIRM|nr:ATPase [Zongyangia hominis]
MVMFLIPAAIVALAAMVMMPMCKRSIDKKSAKRRVVINLSVFFGAIALFAATPIGGMIASAAEPAAAAAATGLTVGSGLGLLAAALVTGLSCVGAGIAVAAAAPAAIGAVSEDPKAFGKSMIFVVLGEGVALYGLLISILIINKL